MVANVKRKSKIAWILVGATVLSGCGSVPLLQTDKGFDNRVYAGAGVLLSQLEPDASEVSGVSVDDSNSAGAGLVLGYDLTDRLSVEGHIADLGEATFSPDGSIGYQVGGLSGIVYGLNHRQDRLERYGFSVFGRLGLGVLNNNASGVRYKRVNDVHLLAGAGVEYGLDSGLAARLELVGHDADASYVQLALLYRFGTDNKRLSASPAATSSEPAVEPTPESADIAAPSATPDSTDGDAAPAATEASSETDSDLDGITDDIDACPASTSGLPVNSVGCDVFDNAVEGIKFEVNSAELTEGGRSVLDGIALALQENPDIKVTIEAHTDNSGPAEENLQLSRRRALAVARFLVDKGIAGVRLRPQAFGESQPRVSNATGEGRIANRRVEFTVFK